jgi:hypothetical protein
MLNADPPTSKLADDLAAEKAETQLAFERSRTFVTRLPDPAIIYLRRGSTIGVLLLGFVIIPLLNLAGVIPDYRVNFIGKYLCFAIAALGIDLIWGYTGLLSLCQALFFCIGGYVMAMHLSLPQGGGDVRPEYNNIPQFMFFNNLTSLPAFWKPFESFPITIIGAIVLPGIVAAVFGFFILRSRVKGVYFSIITQALAWQRADQLLQADDAKAIVDCGPVSFDPHHGGDLVSDLPGPCSLAAWSGVNCGARSRIAALFRRLQALCV